MVPAISHRWTAPSLTRNRRPEQTESPVEVLVELREDLTDLTPEAPRELRVEYTNLLARYTETYTGSCTSNSLVTRPWTTQNTSRATTRPATNPSPTSIFAHTQLYVHRPITFPLAPHKPPATITLPRPPKSTLLTPMLASLIRGFRNFRVFFFRVGWLPARHLSPVFARGSSSLLSPRGCMEFPPSNSVLFHR